MRAIFSSSKETDDSKRNNLSDEMMEKLQILKYLFRELRFADNLVMDMETIIQVVDMDPTVLDRMIQEGRLEELKKLLEHSEERPQGGPRDSNPDLGLGR
ncbi:hypothetical protein MPER_04983 [Moniliophthora perniciosa FA553]|nr:hypothetical protein MPER_04983 [Moniliophthora perniciosa FA553]